MGMRITNEQADTAAQSAVSAINDRFGGSDVSATVEHHANAFKDVVGLEVGPTRNSALTHGDAVLGFGHLLPESDDFVSEFLADGAVDKQHVGLARG